jgi:hypothetical protein
MVTAYALNYPSRICTPILLRCKLSFRFRRRHLTLVIVSPLVLFIFRHEKMTHMT